MPLLTLKQTDYPRLLNSLADDSWLVACFCAGWCNSCRQYRPGLKQLAKNLPDVRFFWVDIEDHGDMLGDLDVDKFPTLLIQRGDVVTFFSCVHPDLKQAERLLQSLMAQSHDELRTLSQSNEERRMWQKEANFKTLLQNGIDAA